MKKIFRFLIINCLPILSGINSSAQTPDWLWAKAFGGVNHDVAKSMAIDMYGNIYTTGYFEGTVDFDPGAGIFNLTSAGSADIFICKLDSSGNFIWAKGTGGGSNERGYSLAIDHSGIGSIYITGDFYGTADLDPGPAIVNFTSNGSGDMFISRFDTSGNLIWAKAMGGTGYEIAYSSAFDPSGGGFIYATGWFNGTVDFDPGPGIFNLTSAASTDDMHICKLDASGSFVWAKQIAGASFSDHGFSIAVDTAVSGDVFTTGFFSGTTDFDPGAGVFNLISSSGSIDCFMSRLDSSGNFVWAKGLGGTGDDRGHSLVIDPSGNGAVYTTGNFAGTVDFDPGAGVYNLSAGGGTADIFVSRLDGSGNFVWAKVMGGTGNDGSSSIAFDLEGNKDVYATGEFTGTVDFDPGAGIFNLTSAGSNDIFICKLDSSGNFIWAKAEGGTAIDRGSCIALNPVGNGSLHLAGQFFSPSVTIGSATLIHVGGSDFFIAKLDTITILTGNNDVANVGNGVFVYPNPATKEIIVHPDFYRDKVQRIEIFNVFGEKIYSSPLNPLKGTLASIDVSSLNAGIYFVRIKTEKESITKKFIKQ